MMDRTKKNGYEQVEMCVTGPQMAPAVGEDPFKNVLDVQPLMFYSDDGTNLTSSFICSDTEKDANFLFKVMFNNLPAVTGFLYSRRVLAVCV
jgi:hypothetical protein